MTAEARKICKYLESLNFYGIEYVESYKEKEWRVQSFNTCGMQRMYKSLGEAKFDTRKEGC